MQDENALVRIVGTNLIAAGIGIVVLSAARRWPRGTSLVVGGSVAIGLLSLGIAAYVAGADYAAPWLITGLALIALAVPASFLVSVAGEPQPARLTWAGVRECLRLFVKFLNDPFWPQTPGEPAREVGRLAQALMAYLAICWVFALFFGFFAHLTNPAGSFR